MSIAPMRALLPCCLLPIACSVKHTDSTPGTRCGAIPREAIWLVDHTSRELVAELPATISFPHSLLRTPDGTLYVGLVGSVLRLTPTWPDPPRYLGEVLVADEMIEKKWCRSNGED